MAFPTQNIGFSIIRDRLGISGVVKLSDMYSLIENGPSINNIIKISDLTGKNITYRFITGGIRGSAVLLYL